MAKRARQRRRLADLFSRPVRLVWFQKYSYRAFHWTCTVVRKQYGHATYCRSQAVKQPRVLAVRMDVDREGLDGRETS